MKRLLFVLSLMLLLPATPSWAEGGYQNLPSAYAGAGLPSGKNSNPLDMVFNKDLGQLNITSPSDVISFDQLQSAISQFPGVNSLNIQFPNKASWITSPTDLLSMHNDFLEQATNLGFGVGGTSIPGMVFSSIAEQSGISDAVPGGAAGLAMIPINTMKTAMSDTFSTALKELRFQQLSLGDWIPDWVRSMFLAIYNFVVPYYDATVNWIWSFF